VLPKSNRVQSVELPGVAPALMGAAEDPSAPGGELPDATQGPGGGDAELDADEPEVEGVVDAGGAVALNKPVEAPEPIVLPEQLLEQALGTSRRDGEYRIVTGWKNATLANVVERWTGGSAALDEVRTLNESVGDQLGHGDEILVPWVDAEALLAAKAAQDTVRSQADWAKGELYVLKKGDSLWKVASQRVATNMIPAWLKQFEGLNPSIADTGTLMEGQKVRLPR